jgi:hypothetical protein
MERPISKLAVLLSLGVGRKASRETASIASHPAPTRHRLATTTGAGRLGEGNAAVISVAPLGSPKAGRRIVAFIYATPSQPTWLRLAHWLGQQKSPLQVGPSHLQPMISHGVDTIKLGIEANRRIFISLQRRVVDQCLWMVCNPPKRGKTAMLSAIAPERASQILMELSKIPEASRFP